jgi:hypothetical protein
MVLVILALLAVPFVVYFLYDLARRGPDGRGTPSPKDWEQDHVVNLGLAGLALAVVGMVVLLMFSGGSRDGIYYPARIENGKLIDGGFNEPDGTPTQGESVD